MITNLCITGAVGEKVKGSDLYRYIEVDRPVPANTGYVVDKIPVCHWSKSPKSPFSKLHKGALISLTGRIEMEKEIGLVVVAENYLILSKTELMTLKQGE